MIRHKRCTLRKVAFALFEVFVAKHLGLARAQAGNSPPVLAVGMQGE